MFTLLLNWRVWVFIGFLGCVAASGYEGYKSGYGAEEASFDAYRASVVAEALHQQKLMDIKEESLQQATNQVGTTYEATKASTVTSITQLSALRVRQRTSSGSGFVSKASVSPSLPASNPQDGVLDECRNRRDELAGEAQQLSDQVTGLQSYIKEITQDGK